MSNKTESQIRMYGTSWCPDCIRAKAVMRRLKVTYIEIDVDKGIRTGITLELLDDGELGFLLAFDLELDERRRTGEFPVSHGEFMRVEGQVMRSGLPVDDGRHDTLLAHVPAGCAAHFGSWFAVERNLFHFLEKVCDRGFLL